VAGRRQIFRKPYRQLPELRFGIVQPDVSAEDAPMTHLNQTRNRARGFTLLELSIVVLVVTLLIGGLLIPLSTQVEQRNISDTQQRLVQIQDALMGFAIAHGRFPCPASVSNPPQPTDQGVEDTPTGVNLGVCNHPIDGYVPGVTLGLTNLDSQGFVVDAWGLQQNRIRYAITNNLANAFTTNGGMQGQGILALGNTNNSFLYVCASAAGITANACSAIPPANPDPNALSRGDAVFVVYSLGKNAATTGGTSPDEAVNVKISPTNTTPVFVSKVASGQTTSEFDDLLLWGSRYSVIGKLTSAGQLP
jgi:prepilin-type N-terminal cleavage/methylation domain-containing protein